MRVSVVAAVSGVLVAGVLTMVGYSGDLAALGGSTRPTPAASSPAEPKEHGPVVTGHIGDDPDPDAITYVYAGDSITARADSWLHVLSGDGHLDAVDGYARSGYRSDQVLDEVPAATGADVLVIEVGTNDINQGKTLDSIVTNVAAIATKVGADHVLLTAAPPSDETSSQWGVNRQRGSVELNARFRSEAATHDWSYTDPFAAYREADNSWHHGASADGIHPTARSNTTVAKVMAGAIERASRSSSLSGTS